MFTLLEPQYRNVRGFCGGLVRPKCGWRLSRTLKASAQHVEIRISGDTVAGEELVAAEIPQARAGGQFVLRGVRS
jgi:hypothetical protein